MAVSTEKLLALKAFYLGHAIAEKHASTATAMAMTSAAIDQLSGKAENQSLLRLAFYHLLRAETLRHGGNPVADRQQAKEICASIGSELYDYFMRIEEATGTKNRAHGLQDGYIANDGVQVIRSYTAGPAFDPVLVRYDIACRAIGANEHALTDRELKFLKHVTLKDMLDKHAISFAP